MKTVLKLAIMITLCAVVSWSVSAYAASGENARKASGLTARASEHMNRREYEQALPLLEEAIRLNPDNRTAMRYLSIYHQQVIEPMCKSGADAYFSGQFHEAISRWEKIISISPPESIRVQALIDTAIDQSRAKELNLKYSTLDRLMEQERNAQAVTELDALLKAFPEEQQDLRHELAQRLIVNARRSTLKGIYDNADRLLRQGEYLKAREAYANALESNPTDPSIAKTLSRLDETMRISTAFTGNSPAERVMSTSIYHYVSPEGNPKISLAAAWYAFQLSPDNTLAQTIRAFMEKKNAQVINLMESPVREMNLVEQYLFASLNHIYEGRYDQTLEKCAIVLELEPDNQLALKRMGSAYYLMGKNERAEGVWLRALELSPADQELKEFLGLLKNPG